MCGRYSRGQKDLFYVEPLISGAGDQRFARHAQIFRPSWNVSPGTKQPIIGLDGSRLEIWGFRPAWAVARNKTKMMVNARMDKAGSSTWKWMFSSGRVLVPADGWYEWVTVEGRKQPYFIKSNDGPPVYFAGLSSVRPDAAPSETPGVVFGFVIVTAAADSGMLDVHDRRPSSWAWPRKAPAAIRWVSPLSACCRRSLSRSSCCIVRAGSNGRCRLRV